MLTIESSDVDSVTIGTLCHTLTLKDNRRVLPFGSGGALFVTMTNNIVIPPENDRSGRSITSIMNAELNISNNEFSGIGTGLSASWTTGLITRNRFLENSDIGLEIATSTSHEITENLFAGNGYSDKDPASKWPHGGLIVKARFTPEIRVLNQGNSKVVVAVQGVDAARSG
ncbi:NosD domain-containing protein, partial [Kibdelosporangium philippinense]|uniref:NosD domain-containing protein n=1 Tax=Kibdelosporangium philippinense TaxID=211113 RepID=UPI0035EC58B5